MIKEAVAKGANAVIGIIVKESEILGCVVVSVSGTACWVERHYREELNKREEKRDSAQDGPFF